MSFADPFGSRFEVFGREHKHTVEGINRPAFEKLRSLLDVRAGGDGRVVLLRAPRAGYGKTSILQRLAGQFAESHHFVRVSLVSGRSTDAVHVLEYVLQALCQVLPGSTTLTRLDLLARRVLALGLEPLVASGEVPCQDREGALVALREQPAETFDFHHDRAVTAHWTKSNFEILGPRMAAELASRSGASLREASYWVELLFRFATTAPDNVERARLLFETVFRGDLQSQSESAAEERLHGLLALCGTVTNLVLIVDDTEGLSTAPDEALALASFLTNISQCCPGTLVLLSLNDDIWESAFLPLLPGGLADRLMENEVALKGLTREEAEALVSMRAGNRAEEVIAKIDWDQGDEGLYSRQVLKWASEVWNTLEHRDESGFDVSEADDPAGDESEDSPAVSQPSLDDPFADDSELEDDDAGMEPGRVTAGEERRVPARSLESPAGGPGPAGERDGEVPWTEESAGAAVGPAEGNPFSEVGGSMGTTDSGAVPGTPAPIFGNPESHEKIPADSPAAEQVNPFEAAARPPGNNPGQRDVSIPSEDDAEPVWSSGHGKDEDRRRPAAVEPANLEEHSAEQPAGDPAPDEKSFSGRPGSSPASPFVTGESPVSPHADSPFRAGAPTRIAPTQLDPPADAHRGREARDHNRVGSPSDPSPGEPQSPQEVAGASPPFSPFTVVSGSVDQEKVSGDEPVDAPDSGSALEIEESVPRTRQVAESRENPGPSGRDFNDPVQVQDPFQSGGSSPGDNEDPAGSGPWTSKPRQEPEPAGAVPSAGYSPFKPVALQPADPSASPFAKEASPGEAEESNSPKGKSASAGSVSGGPGGSPVPDEASPGKTAPTDFSAGDRGSPFVAVGAPAAGDGTTPVPEESEESAGAPEANAASPGDHGKIDELLRQFKERYGRKD